MYICIYIYIYVYIYISHDIQVNTSHEVLISSASPVTFCFSSAATRRQLILRKMASSMASVCASADEAMGGTPEIARWMVDVMENCNLKF